MPCEDQKIAIVFSLLFKALETWFTKCNI